jgi:hypothetical protein
MNENGCCLQAGFCSTCRLGLATDEDMGDRILPTAIVAAYYWSEGGVAEPRRRIRGARSIEGLEV